MDNILRWCHLVSFFIPQFVIFFAYRVTIAGAQSEVSVSVGQTATLPCKTDGIADYLVMWLDKNGNTLTKGSVVQSSDKRLSVLNPYLSEWNLRIQPVTRQDSGNYTCVITLGGKTEKQHQVSLRILVPPSITKVSSDITVATGSDVTILCQATGTPQPNVTWHLNRHQEPSKEVFPLKQANSEVWRLSTINWTRAGQYECRADNGVQPIASATFRVDVTGQPTIQMPYRVVRQSLGSDTLLQCIVIGYPAPKVHWEVSGQPVNVAQVQTKYKRSEYSMGEYRTAVGLVVKDLIRDDCTAYSCVAVNANGKAMDDVTISAWRTELLVAKIGQSISVPCPLSKELVNTSKAVTWYFRDQVIYSPTTGASNSRYVLGADGGLKIASIKVDDAGEYRCEIPVSGHQSIHITVTDGITTCSSVGGSQILLGRTFSLSCSLTYYGLPPRWRVTWTHEPTGQKYDGIIKPVGVKAEDLTSERMMESDLLLQARQELSGRFRSDVVCMECGNISGSISSCSYDVILLPSSASSCSATESDSMTKIAIVTVVFLLVILALAAVMVYLVRKYKRELSLVSEATGYRRSSAGNIQPKYYRSSQSVLPSKSEYSSQDLPAVS